MLMTNMFLMMHVLMAVALMVLRLVATTPSLRGNPRDVHAQLSAAGLRFVTHAMDRQQLNRQALGLCLS